MEHIAMGLKRLKPAGTKAGAVICLIAALPSFGTAALAQYDRTASGRGSAPAFDAPFAPFASVDEWRQNAYHQSGTLGRMGLGADPRHPEGPGNASSPGR